MPKHLDARRFAQLERVARGFSNHRRIQILYLLAEHPEMELTAIANACGINLQTAGEHVRRLRIAALVGARKKGRAVLHGCTPLAQKVLTFLDGLD